MTPPKPENLARKRQLLRGLLQMLPITTAAIVAGYSRNHAEKNQGKLWKVARNQLERELQFRYPQSDIPGVYARFYLSFSKMGIEGFERFFRLIGMIQ
jgi:hypothetical protein